jgi:hypothetical protein
LSSALATPAVEEIEGGELLLHGLEASVGDGEGERELIGGDVGWVGVWVGDPVDELVEDDPHTPIRHGSCRLPGLLSAAMWQTYHERVAR